MLFSEAPLRPKSTITTAHDKSILFLLNGKQGDEVLGTWTLTAEGIDAVQGKIETIVPESIELKPELFRALLIDVPLTIG